RNSMPCCWPWGLSAARGLESQAKGSCEESSPRPPSSKTSTWSPALGSKGTLPWWAVAAPRWTRHAPRCAPARAAYMSSIAAAVPVPGTEFELPVGTVLVAIGEAPDPSFLPEGTSVGVAPWGGLLINSVTLATGAPGVFAAGDVTYGPKSIIQAAAHGRKAAWSIHAYLSHIALRDITE